MGKCSEGDCEFLAPLTCDICCFECKEINRCKFSCVKYDEDENYKYSKCDKYMTEDLDYIDDIKSQIIKEYAKLIYSEFCEIQMTEEQITLKDIAEVLKIDSEEDDK